MIILKVKIIPKSKCNKLVGYENDILKIKINAPAQKGKANKELIYFLAKILSISQRDITIISGETSRIKKIQIENISNEDLNKLIKN